MDDTTQPLAGSLVEQQIASTLLDNTVDLVFAFDRNRRITLWNVLAERLTGVDRAEVIGHPISTVPDLEEWTGGNEVYARVLRGESAFLPRRHYFIAPYGSEGVFDIYFSPLRDEAGDSNGGICIVHDITRYVRAEAAQRKLAEELQTALAELRESQEKLIQTEKVIALGTMAAGLAHELNNPLMGIMGFVGYARNHLDDPETANLLARAEQELVRMADLIKNMLLFSRRTAGEPGRAVDVGQVIRHALALLSPDFKVRFITVDLRIEDGLPRIAGDSGRLEQSVLNLILNARDAVEQSSHKEIRIRAWSKDTHLFIEVSDSGPGISDRIRDHLFEPFFTTKPPGQGTGLGLSLSRSIIEELGGRLTLESREGEGARFLIRLNALPASGEPNG